MTLEQLRIFIAVAEREHVTRAAEALNLTQSATSAAIAALETRHAVRLFDRIGRRIVLTDAGRRFLTDARAVLARATLAERALDDLAGLKRGSLRLSASQTVANYWLPEMMHRFHRDYPGVRLTTSIGNSVQVMQRLHDIDVDIGIIEGEPSDQSLASCQIPGDSLALVVAHTHPWVKHPPRKTSDLLQSPWVLREQGSGTRAALETLLNKAGHTCKDLEVAFELPANEAVCTAVEAGAGAAVLSNLVVRRSLEAGTMAALPFGLPVRTFHLLWHGERQLSQIERRFLDIAGCDPGSAG